MAHHKFVRLTPRQLQVLTLIRDYQNKHGYSPTMQELADMLGVNKVTVFEHVTGLEKKRSAAPIEAQSTLFGAYGAWAGGVPG